jgi:hypothetical protein
VKRSNSGTFAVQKPDTVFSGSAGKIQLPLKSSSTRLDTKGRAQQLVPHHCLPCTGIGSAFSFIRAQDPHPVSYF